MDTSRCDQVVGITCGMEDLVLNPAAEVDRRVLITGAVEKGIHAAAKFAGVQLPDSESASKNQAVMCRLSGLFFVFSPFLLLHRR